MMTPDPHRSVPPSPAATGAHIAFISHRFGKNDGQGRVNYEVIRAALDAGYRVTMVATHCAPDIAAHPRARFVPMGNDSLPTELLRTLFFAIKGGGWLRRHRHEFDLVQANGFVTWERCDVAAAHFVHAAWYLHPTFPFRGWSPYATYQRLFTFLNVGWERKPFSTARRVIAVSSRVGKELAAAGVEAKKIRVIPNGVDPDQFQPGAQERAFFGLPTDVPLALFVGDIRTSRKNLGAVLQALVDVPGLHLAVAGRREGTPYVEMAERLGLGERVHFLGSIKEMERLMRSVDFFVFPSRYEPFGLVVLEAMSSGLPVIVSGDCGAAEYVKDAGTVVTDPDDISGLTAAIRTLVSDSATRYAQGKAGREIALGMRWSAMAASYLTIYEELLQQKSPQV